MSGMLIAEVLVLLACLVVFGLTLKLYTEMFKEQSQRDRNRGRS